MKKIMIASLVLAMLITGCTNKNEGDPKAVADQFIDAVSRNDMPAVKNLTTVESRFVLNRFESSINPSEGTLNQLFNRNDVETGEATISGDEAIVPVMQKNGGQSINLNLKKQLGQWKVALDMNTILQMVNSKIREKGIDLGDSLGKMIPAMDKLNIDSLSKNVRINGKSVDSFRNEFKKRGISLDSLKKRKIDINF